MRVILIAAKELAFAKTRLQTRFPAPERMLLAEAMFRDVLVAALSSARHDHVAVVTSDRLLLETARSAGAVVIDEEFPRGLNAAVALATHALVAEGATTICTVLSDIPLITAADIDDVFDRAPTESGVVLVPSHDWTGTNLMLRRPGEAISTRFGTSSLSRHRDECVRLGLRCEILPLARAALDLDLVADLREFMRRPGNTHTASQLQRLGLASG